MFKLFSLAVMLLFLLSSASDLQAAKNVLFIAVDDLRTELGCYGVSYAKSPNIDALAARSTLFTNHFVQVPTCGASRYALLTGISPAKSGVTASNAAFSSGTTALQEMQQPGAQTLPELFNRSGYETVLIGKISHTADGRVYDYNGAGNGRDELPHAWDQLATPLGPWDRGWGIFFAYANGKHREDGQGHNDLMDFVVQNDDDLPDGLMASTAIQKLGELKGKQTPFFMGLGFFKPHLPFVAPEQDWDAFADIEIPPPPHPEKPNSPNWHGSSEFFKYKFPFEKNPLSPENVINCRRAYLACVRYTDRQVGRVLQALEDEGLSESTIVVLWGDHGWNLGDSNMWGKHTPFERAVHSPLMIHIPGLAAGTCDAPVETLDIYPTLVDLCEPSFTKTNAPLDGISLKPVLENPHESVRETAVSYWKNEITIRTKTHRLIVKRYKNSYTNIELYSREQQFDPVKNLAAEQPLIVEELLRQLSDHPAVHN